MKNLFLVLFLSFFFSLFSQKEAIHFDDFYKDELRSQAFELSSNQTLKLEAIGPRIGFREENSFIWILDLESRDAVWVLDDAESERGENRRLREYSDEISLKKGRYKIYFATNAINSFNNFSFNIKDIFDFDSYGRHYRRRDLREFDLKLYGTMKLIPDADEDLKKLGKYRIVNETKAEDDIYKRMGLRVKSNTEVLIYAVGEVTRDGNYDSAWIKNTKTGKKVWELNRRSSDYAGGGEKNRFFRERVKLDKGNYVLTLVSDDSHHYDEWNVIPPYDPDAWGFSLYADTKSAVEVTDYKESEEKNIIVALTEMGDNEYKSKGFTLTKDMNVRVYALGEGYRHDDLADYGWIIDASNHRKVWEMDEYNTDHAGGASKNRVADEVIRLKKGSYIVYYVTDDSHSYGDRWNSSKPYDGEHWGITLYGSDENFNKNSVKAYKEKKEKNVLAQISRVRDNDYESERFTLSEDTKVRIYAIGEGSSGDMHDYGWIKSMDSGRKVWRMDYYDTEHAGGARKNRVADEVITLEKGDYKVYYKTDGSHSFRDWNARAPYDQEHWGISIYKVD